jgi:hypothetical protein
MGIRILNDDGPNALGVGKRQAKADWIAVVLHEST